MSTSHKSRMRRARTTSSHRVRHRTHASPRPVPRSIARAVGIKDEDRFFLCDASGEVPLGNVDGLGLYYHDCRYLNGYELRIADTTPNTLTSTSKHGFMAAFELTNHEIAARAGGTIRKQRIGLRWERIVDAARCSLLDRIVLRNFGHEPVAFPLSFAFESAFDDVFTIRGFHPGKIGRIKEPAWTHGVLTFAYAGADGIDRGLYIQFEPAPRSVSAGGATIEIALRPGQSKEVHIALAVKESSHPSAVRRQRVTGARSRAVTSDLRRTQEQWLDTHTQVTSSSSLLNRVMDRSLGDLRVLRSTLGGKAFFCAGLPWYGTLFGRDSLIAAIETLAYEPKIAEETLRLLAEYQGTKVDDWRDEQPGKILHELRLGELANLNEIPQTPYYGSVDATPLFLILIGLHAQWTGDLSLFHDLGRHIERAFNWIATYGESTGTGYVAYQSKSSKGLGNQGWKDSGDAIVNADGSLATPPISLVEVQGYVYLAKRVMADLYEQAGDHGTAARLLKEAGDLRTRFNRDFWLSKKGTYALALQAGKKPAAVVSSNPGQALWSGIADAAKARKVVRHLMEPDMFSGWGVRTLSSQERRYNPIGYHLGTVWPHDNAIIVAGLRRYGFDEAAGNVLTGLVRAAEHFEHHRLPETFCGFSCDQYGHPVRYPVACHPQAWAAGAVPFMLERLLGLKPSAFEKRLRIERPLLPEGVNEIELRRLRVGEASVDLRFARTPHGHVGVDVLAQHGDLQVDVDVEPAPTRVGAA
jgi:glycogen debranching enzyme